MSYPLLRCAPSILGHASLADTGVLLGRHSEVRIPEASHSVIASPASAPMRPTAYKDSSRSHQARVGNPSARTREEPGHR